MKKLIGMFAVVMALVLCLGVMTACGSKVDEETKKIMVDYIADNYGDHEGEITDKEINDALLSYYKSYADALAKGENPTLPDDVVIPGGTEIPGGEG